MNGYEDETIEVLKSRREQTIADVVAFRDKALKGLDHTRALIEQSRKAIDETWSTLGRVVSMSSVKSPANKPMPKLIWDKTYWSFRAEEARAAASEIRNLECREIMRRIAESYDRLAEHTKKFRAAAAKMAPAFPTVTLDNARSPK